MNAINIIISIIVFGNLLEELVVCSDNWSYNDPVTNPSTWHKNYPKCGGKRQSPINITSKKALFDGSFSDLNIHYSTLVDLNITNNGRMITAKLPNNVELNFTGAGLKSIYELDRFHFHVGADSSQGSEHQIDGKKYPMELQLVHYDVSKSSDIAAAIMSVLITQGSLNNNHFDKLINSLQNCSYKDNSNKLLDFSVRDILPNDIQAFYRYSGSFTTPPCNDVEWVIFHQTVSISSAQLQKFRSVFSSSKQETKPLLPLVNNFRPVQALNNRIVRRNFDHPKFICGKKSNLSADCRTTIEGHDVFYEVKIKPCTLPVSAVIKISAGGLGFNVQNTLSEDLTSPPIIISNLNYGVSMEMHFHAKGLQTGKLHVTVNQFPMSQVTNKSKVIDQYFQVEGVCSRGNCTMDEAHTQWCSSTIGIQKPLFVGFSSKPISPCGSPSVAVEVYRSEYMKQSWVLTAKQEFKDKQTYLINLTRSLVDGKYLRMRKSVAMTSKLYTAVYLEAHVEKISGGKINFEVYLLVKSNGGHYLVFNTQYNYPSLYCKKKKSVGEDKKVAIGVIIVLVLVLIIGVAAFLLYRNRRNYFGHRPALVDEIEVQDADRL